MTTVDPERNAVAVWMIGMYEPPIRSTRLHRRPFPEAVRWALDLPASADDMDVIAEIGLLRFMAGTLPAPRTP